MLKEWRILTSSTEWTLSIIFVHKQKTRRVHWWVIVSKVMNLWVRVWRYGDKLNEDQLLKNSVPRSPNCFQSGYNVCTVHSTILELSLSYKDKVWHSSTKISEKYDFNKFQSKADFLCGLWKVVGHDTDSPSPEAYLICMYKAGSMTLSKFSLWPHSVIGYNEVG
jgi:hypothetical protein